jgi:hypothetical protein
LGIANRLKRAWNVFLNQPQPVSYNYGSQGYTSERPDRTRVRGHNERSILASILTRISIDVAGIDFRHVKLDEQGRYSDDIDSGLNRCFSFEANLDQGPREFKQDIAMKMLDSNAAVIVPVDVLRDSETGEVYDILTLRVGVVVDWFPKHVRVSLWNEETGRHEEIVLPKRDVAIPTNPMYTVMNGPNSTLNRLIRKLNLLDVVDDKTTSGKLDLIIQLPWEIKQESQRVRAEQRRKDLEDQMSGSQYGIAYSTATEKIIQLNRPVENNLLGQIEYLMKLLYSQLGLTAGVMDGSATEEEMLNYYDRTIEPIAESVAESVARAFLGRAGLENKERVRYYKNPFKLIPLSQLAEVADKFTRNEILSSNEIREAIGMKPSKDPKADQLINSNMPQPQLPAGEEQKAIGPGDSEPDAVSAAMDEVEAALDEVLGDGP